MLSEMRVRRREIYGCALAGTLGILLIDLLILQSDVYYYSDDIYVLYSVAVHSLMATPWHIVRPLQYLIVLAANELYLPLWFGASLFCAVGATVLSVLACERVFERQLPRTGWWLLGLANPLLFYLVSQPDTVSQGLSNILFAGALLAFVSELHLMRGRPSCVLRADTTAVLLNIMSAAQVFTKETGIAAAIILPAAAALIRLRARRLSAAFLFSLLLPFAAVCGWVWLRLNYSSVILPDKEGARYSLVLDPIAWAQNSIITLAFPITPLPSSFIAFELLRPVWIVTAVGCVILFLWLVSRASWHRPTVVFPLISVVASCAPMILIRTDELYPTMIAPFAVSIVFLFGTPRLPLLSLAYSLLLFASSFGNAIIYRLGADFDMFGLGHLEYSIYSKTYQSDPICPITTTAHVAWDGAATGYLPDEPNVNGRIVCVR